ncbi:unnamed protein product [Notodromas monacha]|uniref:Natterin-3 n=1 Tax=Notodromas monacha TaxID=399045 RepID=A0A7R9GCP0_9CRUS|nr:unnamed protein product [Notodromas monacha]CAG0916305.1 unnamed protein product [Notodromas monacha]
MSQFKKLEWVDGVEGAVPDGAVVGGDDNGEPLYVARAEHNGEMLPGKVLPRHGVCYISWGGEEIPKHSYQVLTNPCGCSLVWTKAEGGDFPTGAVMGGRAGDGEALFVGRAEHEGSVCLGKIHPSNEVLYLPYGGAEVPKREYEVLAVRCLELD